MSAISIRNTEGSQRRNPAITSLDVDTARETLYSTCNAIKTTIRSRRGIFAANSTAIRDKIQYPYVGEAYESIQIRLISALDHAFSLL